MIAIADIHWDKTTDSVLRQTMKGMLPSQLIDVDTRMREVAQACEEGDHSLVIMGDVFNKVNPPTNIIGMFLDTLWDFIERGIKVYIIPGNHDYSSVWANVGMLSGIPLSEINIITTPQEVDIDGVEVLMVPHVPSTFQGVVSEGNFGKWLIKHFGNNHKIIISHGQVVNLNYSNDIFFEAADALAIDPNTWPEFNLMALGHVHKYHEMSNDRATIVYPGSLRITNFGEVDDQKGYLVINSDTDWKWLEYASAVTPYVHVDIDLVNKDEVDLSDDVVQELANGAVVKIRVVARDRTLVDEPAIRRAFNKYAHVSRFETIIDKGAGEVDTNALFTELSHSKQLSEYIKGMDAPESVKKLAVKLGGELISEVLGD